MEGSGYGQMSGTVQPFSLSDWGKPLITSVISATICTPPWYEAVVLLTRSQYFMDTFKGYVVELVVMGFNLMPSKLK